jgi:hypothetical protein
MGIGMRSRLATAFLAVAFSFIAKDLAVPLLGLSAFGLFDRLVAWPALRAARA